MEHRLWQENLGGQGVPLEVFSPPAVRKCPSNLLSYSLSSVSYWKHWRVMVRAFLSQKQSARKRRWKMPDEMSKAAAYHGQGDVPCPTCLHVSPSLRVTFFLEEVATFLPVSRELWRGCLTMWFSFPRRHAIYPFSAGEDTKEKERQQCPEINAK